MFIKFYGARFGLNFLFLSKNGKEICFKTIRRMFLLKNTEMLLSPPVFAADALHYFFVFYSFFLSLVHYQETCIFVYIQKHKIRTGICSIFSFRHMFLCLHSSLLKYSAWYLVTKRDHYNVILLADVSVTYKHLKNRFESCQEIEWLRIDLRLCYITKKKWWFNF